MNVGEATHALLADLGMTTTFGNPGSTELRFFKGAPPGYRYILALQEASAVAMADGYAQATRSAAFVNLHSAVGVGHALGSIFTAMRNQAPLVITAGQQTRAMLPLEPFLFSEQATELPKPYVKWSCEPARGEDVPAAIARAYHTALQHPQGPTFVSIPEDDWAVDAQPVTIRQVSGEFEGDATALQAVADGLNRSQRPAIVVGPGVDRDGAWDLAVELAERAAAAVWVSPLSSRCSFPEDHAAFAGFLVPERRKLAEQLRGYDLVLVVGAPVFTYHVHAEGPILAAGTELFLLCDDPAAAARAPVGTAVLTTLRPALVHLLANLELHDRPPPAGRGSVAGATSAPSSADPLSGDCALAAIARVLPRDAVVVEEAPSHRNALHDHLPIRTSGGFYAAASGGLGYALPASVGVALGVPERPVVCLVGDGSSLYSIQALWTAAQHQLPIAFIVLNNGGYAALRSLGRRMGIDDPPGVDLPGLDLVSIAHGFGCAARRVEQAEDLEAALSSALGADGPTLLDVTVESAVPDLY